MQIKLDGKSYSEYLTTGKVYEAEQLDGALYRMTDDYGDTILILVGRTEVTDGFCCAHAAPANWIEA